MNKLKFQLDYLPVNCHYNNLRHFFKKEIWQLIIFTIREYKKYTCEFCLKKFNPNNKTSLKSLHCHEYWVFDYENKKQILLDILLLCSNCHNTQHINLASLKEWDKKAIKHFMKINNIENYEFNELKRKNLLFRKNYIDSKVITRDELDKVDIWFFENKLEIIKYFDDKEVGKIIQDFLFKISN